MYQIQIYKGEASFARNTVIPLFDEPAVKNVFLP